jgi:hypothetical protein
MWADYNSKRGMNPQVQQKRQHEPGTTDFFVTAFAEASAWAGPATTLPYEMRP